MLYRPARVCAEDVVSNRSTIWQATTPGPGCSRRAAQHKAFTNPQQTENRGQAKSRANTEPARAPVGHVSEIPGIVEKIRTLTAASVRQETVSGLSPGGTPERPHPSTVNTRVSGVVTVSRKPAPAR
ncbi:hypothetical protein NDU88_003395 [Pleurodeles waltl]|uniref:Uncharacterized protein n=1 Tax=Pleurodeles waltl TaxID=8319 RepID=A0AAV7UDX7_PLEWA|nr:hypothetical protein NDU88_003395 [Pleurodeles waltl]